MVKSNEQLWRMSGRLGVGCAVLHLLGCGDLLDYPRDPELIATGPWRCLQPQTATQAEAAAAAAAAAPAMEPTAEVVVQACDFITGCRVPVTGLSAMVCDKLDVACSSPRLAGITDVNGLLSFEVPTAGGFDGYLRVVGPAAPCTDATIFGTDGADVLCDLAPGCDQSAPDERCDVPVFTPVLLFFNPPVFGDIAQPLIMPMFPSAALPPLVQAASSVTLDPERASVFMTTVDCDGAPSSGVSYSIAEHEDEVRSLYLSNGVVTDTTEQTDASGIGGLILVPPGFVQVTASSEDVGPIGGVSVVAAPSFLTLTTVVPTLGL